MQYLTDKVTELFNKGSHIAHDINHVTRVVALAKFIAKNEGYDVEVAEVASLLHDIGRTVQESESGHGPAGVPLASQLLDQYTNYDAEIKKQILSAVENHSYLNTEGQLTHILQDADMLDGMGAVGIMRAYSANADLPCYDVKEIIPFEGKRKTTMNHSVAFQMEWLNKIHTETAKKIAIKRFQYMQKFLEQFRDEVNGTDYLQS